MSRFTLDTNIIFYAFDARDIQKHLIADRLLRAALEVRLPVPLQVLSEFYQASASKLMEPEQASALVTRMISNLVVTLPTQADLPAAMSLHQAARLQFFDCMILIVAARAGCTVLFSEDMQHLQTYAGVQVVNPFRLSPQELSPLLST